MLWSFGWSWAMSGWVCAIKKSFAKKVTLCPTSVKPWKGRKNKLPGTRCREGLTVNRRNNYGCLTASSCLPRAEGPFRWQDRSGGLWRDGRSDLRRVQGAKCAKWSQEQLWQGNRGRIIPILKGNSTYLFIYKIVFPVFFWSWPQCRSYILVHCDWWVNMYSATRVSSSCTTSTSCLGC